MTTDAGMSAAVSGQGVGADAEFRTEVLAGLSRFPKHLSPKWLYDERGSRLFDEITRLEEYYLTRVETTLLMEHGHDMARALGAGSVLIEYGSGSSTKTRLLLDRLPDLAGYVPIDISEDHLLKAASELRTEYPGLPVVPVVADYTQPFDLPPEVDQGAHRVVFFPGSTIGNFQPMEARTFLAGVARICDHDGGLLIGFDLKKDPAVLHRAYNDAAGVTARFNLNLLRRVNRELGGNFDLDSFIPYALYNPVEGRIEMHLVSMVEQTVEVAGRSFHFAEGESLWTESSYKFSISQFTGLASDAGFEVVHTWTDDARWFAVMYLEAR